MSYNDTIDRCHLLFKLKEAGIGGLLLNAIRAVEVLKETRGPWPRAFDNPEGAPRLRRN